MKNALKNLGHALWSKAVLAAIIVALCGALGYEISATGADRLACVFPGVSGCENVSEAK
jgi:hypothetical protein